MRNTGRAELLDDLPLETMEDRRCVGRREQPRQLDDPPRSGAPSGLDECPLAFDDAGHLLRNQEGSVDAVERPDQRLQLAEVALDERHARWRRLLLVRELAVHRPDRDATRRQLVNDVAAEISGGTNNENHIALLMSGVS